MWRPHITGQRQPAVPRAPISQPRYVLSPAPPVEELQVGNLACSARGCSEPTALACEQLDRRGRACPTAWCHLHRTIDDGRVRCPLHDAANGEAEGACAELAALSWVVRRVDSVVSAAIETVCVGSGQNILTDAVRLLPVGVDRTRMWERGWKAVSHVGISLRVYVAIAESMPYFVIARVNSHVVAAVPMPPEAIRHRSDETGDDSDPEVESFCTALTQPIVTAATSWRAIERARASSVVHLTGTPIPRRHRIAP